MNKPGINIELTNTEGLILYEFIRRITSEEYKEIYNHRAEESVLWDIECILEKTTRISMNKDFEKEMVKVKEEYINQR